MHFEQSNPANLFTRQVAALRQTLVESVTADDIMNIAAALIQKATEGNVQAAKLLFTYVIGKPQPAPEPRMDADERDVNHATAPMQQESSARFNTGKPEAHPQIAPTTRPVAAQTSTENLSVQLFDTLDERKARLSGPPTVNAKNGDGGKPSPVNGKNGRPDTSPPPRNGKTGVTQPAR